VRTRGFTTWEAAAKGYLAAITPLRSSGTVKSKRNRLKHFVAGIGASPAEIDPATYRHWLDGLAASSVSRTVPDVHGEAVRLLRWMRHPLTPDVELIRVTRPRRPIRYFSHRDLDAILGWCLAPQPQWRDRRLAVYVLIVATSGMRIGEACELRWTDWDAKRRRFHLTKTKTGRSRWALVHPTAARVIEQWRAEAPEYAAMVVWSQKSPGGPISPNYLRMELKRLSERLGVQVTSKVFRATVVKRVVEAAGYDEAAAVVGHTSTQTTAQYYRHITLDPKAERAHASAFEGVASLE